MTSKLVPCHPDHERFDAVAWSVVSAALALTIAVFGAAALGWIGSLAGWLLLLAATPVALLPLLRWRWRTADADRLAVGHLDPEWRTVLDRAAEACDRLEGAWSGSAPGAVADHLATMHASARAHLRAMHEAACSVADLTQAARQALLADARLTTRRLIELADAGDRLRAAQDRRLGADPLVDLVEATDRLAAALRGDELGAPPEGTQRPHGLAG